MSDYISPHQRKQHFHNRFINNSSLDQFALHMNVESMFRNERLSNVHHQLIKIMCFTTP